jgi:hypothetical protein
MGSLNIRKMLAKTQLEITTNALRSVKMATYDIGASFFSRLD